jgi:hypothetical protein
VADLSAKPRAGHCRHAAVAASSLSAPLATILSAPSGNGCCNALASSHGAHPNVTLFIGQRLNGQALNVTRAAAAPTRPKPRPASPDDLKARLSLWGQVKIKLGATCRRLKRPLAESAAATDVDRSSVGSRIVGPIQVMVSISPKGGARQGIVALNTSQVRSTLRNRGSIPLEHVRRLRDTPIWKLEAAPKCRSCRT